MDTRTEKLFASSALAACVLFFLGLLFARLLPPPPPDWSAAETAAFYVRHRNSILWGSILAMCGAALLGPFIAVLVKHVRRIEGPDSVSAYCVLGSGFLLILILMLPMTWLQAAAFRPNRSPEAILVLSDMMWIPMVGMAYAYLVQELVLAFVILRDKHEPPIFPRWTAYANLLSFLMAAPGMFVVFHKTGPLAWNGVLGWWLPCVGFGFFVLPMTFAMLKAIQRREAAEEPAPSTTAYGTDELAELRV